MDMVNPVSLTVIQSTNQPTPNTKRVLMIVGVVASMTDSKMNAFKKVVAWSSMDMAWISSLTSTQQHTEKWRSNERRQMEIPCMDVSLSQLGWNSIRGEQIGPLCLTGTKPKNKPMRDWVWDHLILIIIHSKHILMIPLARVCPLRFIPQCSYGNWPDFLV